MPKTKSNSVPVIFDQFVSSLGLLIKEKVAEAVQAATSDFFTSKLGLNIAKEAKPAKRGKARGRGRPKKVVVKAAAKPRQKAAKVAKVAVEEEQSDI